MKIKNFLKQSHNQEKIFLYLLLLIGVMVRVFKFGLIPNGLNQDEAFAGYEAFSLFKYGVDSSGYTNPSYFVSWGSGMNVLESYLAIPFIALLGNTVIAIRLPQLIFACLSLPVFYLLLKELFSTKTALLGLGLLAISPWHILLSRWALESNLAPCFLLFGLYFFIKGVKKNIWWILSAISYGLALYAYAITWIVVPLTLFCFLVYLFIQRAKIEWKYAVLSLIILFMLALPHILFLLINRGFIPEIKTPFLSIPKLSILRDAEVSLRNMISPSRLRAFFNLLLFQEDPTTWSIVPGYGLFYTFSMPFAALGMVSLLMSIKKNFKKHVVDTKAFIAIGAVCSALCCMSIAFLNVNKSNSLHFYTLIFITLGIRELCYLLKNYKTILGAIIICYVVSFASFCTVYFTSFNNSISYSYRYGVEQCVDFVNEQNFSNIAVDADIFYSQILYFDETPYPEYAESVVRKNSYGDVAGFGKYTFTLIEGVDLSSYDAIITDVNIGREICTEEQKIFEFGNYCVVY